MPIKPKNEQIFGKVFDNIYRKRKESTLPSLSNLLPHEQTVSTTLIKIPLHLKSALFPTVILSYTNYRYTKKLLSSKKVASLPLLLLRKRTYENEITVSTKSIIAQTWLTRLAALFKTIPVSNQLRHCSTGARPYRKKKKICTTTNKLRCNTQFFISCFA